MNKFIVEPNDENLERYKRVQDIETIETGVTAKFRGQTYQVRRPVA